MLLACDVAPLGAVRQRDEVRAESEFKAALALDPQSGGAFTALANLYWNRNDLAAAEQAFKTAADAAPISSIASAQSRVSHAAPSGRVKPIKPTAPKPPTCKKGQKLVKKGKVWKCVKK